MKKKIFSWVKDTLKIMQRYILSQKMIQPPKRERNPEKRTIDK